ncbi:triose-phosphate isomerase [Candidatus Kaiserbacteria bacterium]|nr:triose-phosphate isomerase [Candidatus Kaiserbacteria bacterium]
MKSLVVANWKMNPQTFREAKQLFEATRRAAESVRSVSLVVAPPALYLRELKRAYKGRKISLAAQNAHAAGSGAYTGELSLTQVQDAGASYVLIGHAERRAAGEGNDDVRKKVAAALSTRLAPILCVGEATRSPRGEHFLYVAEQLQAGFADVLPGKANRVIVAYEPVWAIGTQKSMTPADMHEMAIFIRKTVQGKGHNGLAIKILYGGSIDERNAHDMIERGDVNGLLVGRASTEAKKFADLLEALHES